MYEIRALYPDAMAADLAYRREQLTGRRGRGGQVRATRRNRRRSGR